MDLYLALLDPPKSYPLPSTQTDLMNSVLALLSSYHFPQSLSCSPSSSSFPTPIRSYLASHSLPLCTRPAPIAHLTCSAPAPPRHFFARASLSYRTRFARALANTQAQAVVPPSEGRYRNTFDAIRTIYRHEGFGAFYKGLLPSLMGVTHVAVQFPLYEAFKSWAGTSFLVVLADGIDPEGNQSSLPPSTILICSAASKMIASLATYPHEVLRTRLQIAKASASSTSTSTSSTSSLSSASSSSASGSGSGGTRPHLYSPLVTGSQPPPRLPFTETPQSANTWRRRTGGIVDTALKIKRQDGWRGFYRGLSINLVRTVPNSAVTMLS
jgi:hypothetical protein